MANYAVKHVMRRCQVRDIQEYDTLAKAVLMLDEHDISAMPVKDNNGHYVGVISRSDIARPRLLDSMRAHQSPDAIFVKQFMNHTKPVTISESLPLAEAIELLHCRHIHRLFVTDYEGQLVGVLSATDIVKMLYVERGSKD